MIETRPYLDLYHLFKAREEAPKFAHLLTRCLMQGVVYRDFGGMAFGEFIEDGHFFIYGWTGKGTLARFLDQYEASAGLPIRQVSWHRIRANGTEHDAGPYPYNRIRRIIHGIDQS
jgi:hypothetical protein